MNERIIKIVNNNDRRELDEVISALKYDKDPELLKSIKTIGFDNHTFKLICKRKIEILLFLIEAVSGIKLDINNCYLADTELLSGVKLKTQICDFYVKATNKLFDYGIDVESEQKTNLTDAGLFDRAVLSACKIYADLHKEGENYRDNKRSIVIYFCNDKYKRDKKLNKEPFSTTKLVDIDTELKKTYDNIIIYRINVSEAIEYGFKNRIKNDKILIEALKVLSSDNIDKFIDSKDEVIKTMAEEIKKINADENEHKNSVLEELAAIRHDMDLGNTYRDGKEESKKEDVINLYEYGMAIEDIAKALKVDLSYVKGIVETR